MHAYTKRFTTSILFLTVSIIIMGAIRTPEEASRIAASAFINSVSNLHKAPSEQEMRLRQTVLKTDSITPAFYIFERNHESGFAVVSADDRTEQILCYSTEGTLDEETMNPSMRWWLRRFQKEISVLPEDIQGTAAPAADSYTAVEPLLGSIAWDQVSPYNDQCPMSVYYPTERCLTGCVATASAQIMKYWQWPLGPTGSHSYTYTEYRSYTSQSGRTCTDALDFDTIRFDWANMLDQYGYSYSAEQGQAVAALMHACGVACNMQYGSETSGGSGAWTDDMGEAFHTYFGYKPGVYATTATQSSYTRSKGPVANVTCAWGLSQQQLLDSIYADLLAGRPVLMGGEDDQEGGHEFVCDGIDARGRLHINWGWSGECNCYTTISSLRPTGENIYFADEIDAMLHLEPAQMDTVWATSIEVTPSTCTLNINQTTTLKANVLPQNATISTYEWTSTNPNVASVDTRGSVMGVSQGTAYIIARSTDGGFTDSCLVNVSNRICVTMIDTIYASDLSATTTDYALFANVEKTSGAVYAGNTAQASSRAIQMRTYRDDKNIAGIYTTTSGGRLKSVEIEWESHSGNGCSLLIYTPANAYTNCGEVHADSFTGRIGRNETIYQFEGDYPHIGLMSDGGTSLINHIIITWEQVMPEPSSVLNYQAEQKAIKIIHNGQILIQRNGKMYDLLGREM